MSNDMSNPAWSGDDELLAELREALGGVDARQEAVLHAEKSLYTWRTIDAELATMTLDSTVARTEVVVRSETATLRTVTFTAPNLTIELEITPGGLVGQLVPPGRGTAWLRTTTGTTDPVEINELGCFVLEPSTDGPYSLVCRTAEGRHVMTNWITP